MSPEAVLEHDWFPRPRPSNVAIGSGSWIYSSYAFLHYESKRPYGVRIGHDTGVYVGTFFDLGPDAEVEIGNYVTLTSPTISTNGRVLIGDYTMISYQVIIADGHMAGPPNTLQRRIYGHNEAPRSSIEIGENSWIGAKAILLPGARLGEGAIVGAATVVDFEVPAYAIVAGSPPRQIGWARPEGKTR